MAVNTKIKRLSLKDEILKLLEERILTGELKPGDRIKELDVADEMGTSQAPVREAIRTLEVMGYVKHKQHTGAKVKEFSYLEMIEAFKAREALELFSLERDIESLAEKSEEFKKHLRGIENAAQSGDVKKYSKHDKKFHRLIVSASGNKTMVEVWDSLQVRYRVEKMLSCCEIPLGEMSEFHAPIIDAVVKCDKESATKILKEHYRYLHKYYERLV